MKINCRSYYFVKTFLFFVMSWLLEVLHLPHNTFYILSLVETTNQKDASSVCNILLPVLQIIKFRSVEYFFITSQHCLQSDSSPINIFNYLQVKQLFRCLTYLLLTFALRESLSQLCFLSKTNYIHLMGQWALFTLGNALNKQGSQQ